MKERVAGSEGGKFERLGERRKRGDGREGERSGFRPM